MGEFRGAGLLALLGAMGRNSQMNELRELRLAFLRAREDNPLRKSASDEQRRERRLDVIEFDLLYGELRDWVSSRNGCPSQAFIDGVTALKEIVAATEGRKLTQRHTMYITRR